MATKKTVKKVVNAKPQLYAMNSTADNDLNYPTTLDDIMITLSDWDFSDAEVVTVYKLVPYKKYRGGSNYVEIN